MCKHMRYVVLGVATIVSIGLLVGCPSGSGNDDNGGNDNGSGDGGGGGSSSSADGLLVGRVLSVEGDPVAGASVTLSVGRSSITDDNGFYSFSDFDQDEVVVARFEASGFASTSKSLTAIARDTATPVCVFLAEEGERVTLDAGSETTQRAGESTVTLAADSLVDAQGRPVTGDVELTTTFIDPSSNAVVAFPGSFDDAATAGGQSTTLESFGFATYELSQNGEPVDLAPGQTARIEYTLPSNAQERFNVGDTIPLWEFDEDTAMWIEAGTGEVGLASNGSGLLAWFADVEHFSAWNCDAPVSEKHCISGRVLHDGAPVAGAEIAAIGQTYNGTSVVFSRSDGTFCVEVKRGSTVTLQVRINGAAIPISSQTVTVPDESTACPLGPCKEVGDLTVDLDSCVQGRVTNEDGTPAAGLRVHIAPGETVTTDADGFYCGAAAGNADVAVFVESRPSISVRTPASGACGGTCAEANLEFVLPDAGDIVGFLSATEFLTLNSISADSEFFGLSGFFASFGDVTDPGNLFGQPDSDVESQEFGDCTVTSFDSSFVSDPDSTPDFSNFGSLDPGEPGTASNGSATVSLFADNSGLSGFGAFFSPVEDSQALVDLGFGAGQTINWSFPGGADIGAFSGALRMPDRLIVTSPDFSDPNLTISNSGALSFVWNAGSSDVVFVSVVTGLIDTTTGFALTVITCQFPDSGSGTIPAGAMALLPSNATTSVSVRRTASSQISVPLQRVSGSGIVWLSASVSVSRTLSGIEVPDIPDIPTDFCDLITCPEGTVCNPTTFQCE